MSEFSEFLIVLAAVISCMVFAIIATCSLTFIFDFLLSDQTLSVFAADYAVLLKHFFYRLTH